MDSACLPEKKSSFPLPISYKNKAEGSEELGMTSLARVGFSHILCTIFYFLPCYITYFIHWCVPYYFVNISIYCCSLSISLESFAISKTYIFLHVSIRLTINTVIFCCSHCIIIWNHCPAAVYEQFPISGCATDLVHPLHLQNAGVITALLRLKLGGGWSKGRVSKDSKKIISGRRRPKRYLKYS